MFSLWAIITWIVFGWICGVIAKALVPGDENLNFWATSALGVCGSLLGGFLNWFIWGGALRLTGSGFVMSIAGASALCFVYANRSKIQQWAVELIERLKGGQ